MAERELMSGNSELRAFSGRADAGVGLWSRCDTPRPWLREQSIAHRWVCHPPCAHAGFLQTPARSDPLSSLRVGHLACAQDPAC